MTKAERIFNDTYIECRNIVKHFGYEENSRLSSLVMKDTETVSTRTFNAIAKLIESERKSITAIKKFNMERAEMLTNALNMVENTLNKTIEIQKEIDFCEFICD